MVHRWVPALLAAALLAPLPLAGAGVETATTTHVHMEGFAFSPQVVSILVGDTITWDNHDANAHTATANDGSWNSGTVLPGGTYQRTFNEVGSIGYHCAFHPSMVGTIAVSDPDALADLVVSGFTFTDVVPGVTKQVAVEIRNLGLAAAPPSDVTVSYVYEGEVFLIGTAEAALLGPGNNATIRVEWNTALKVGDFQIRALADANGEVLESVETNNEGVGLASILVSNVPGRDLRDPL